MRSRSCIDVENILSPQPEKNQAVDMCELTSPNCGPESALLSVCSLLCTSLDYPSIHSSHSTIFRQHQQQQQQHQQHQQQQQHHHHRDQQHQQQHQQQHHQQQQQPRSPVLSSLLGTNNAHPTTPPLQQPKPSPISKHSLSSSTSSVTNSIPFLNNNSDLAAAAATAVGTQVATLVVFVGRVHSKQMRMLCVDCPPSLAALSMAVESDLGIPLLDQQIIALQSPSVECFNVADQLNMHTTRLNTSAAFLIKNRRQQKSSKKQGADQTPDSDTTTAAPTPTPTPKPTTPSSARASTQHTSSKKNRVHSNSAPSPPSLKNLSKQPITALQEEVRKHLTKLLSDPGKQVGLGVLAHMTLFSKSALSLWRRGMYRGNNQHITRAVSAALATLEACEFKYVPSLHDATCTFGKQPSVRSCSKARYKKILDHEEDDNDDDQYDDSDNDYPVDADDSSERLDSSDDA